MSVSDQDLEFLIALLKQAGENEIMPRFRKLSGDDITEKKDVSDLVTIADEASEKFLTTALKDRFPEATIIGEEAVSADESILENFPGNGMNIVIDPIDGTFNFANGITLFAIILAVVDKGETICGIIYDPVMKDCIFARKGMGGFYRSADGQDRPLELADQAPFEEMTGMISWNDTPRELLTTMLYNQTRNPACFNYRCGAQAYMNFVGGGVHYTIYGGTMPWDHLAGSLIVEEAGGHVACFDGTPYTPNRYQDGLIHAPSKQMWDLVRQELWKPINNS